MTDTSLGFWLRRERERRGITLRTIADQTKVAAPLLEGLENGDLSRWPGGIYRRAFVKAYARALGLDADEVVKRFEQEHPPVEPVPELAEPAPPAPPSAAAPTAHAAPQHRAVVPFSSRRARLSGTTADLAVALILGLGSAAAESRLLWPVLLIAVYYGIGVLLTGTSPMVALLADPAPTQPARPEEEAQRGATRQAQAQAQERRHQPRRAGSRPARPAGSRTSRPRLQ